MSHRLWRYFRPIGEQRVGRCFRITKWGNDRDRWLWLRFGDGSEKAYAPSHVREVEPE